MKTEAREKYFIKTVLYVGIMYFPYFKRQVYIGQSFADISIPYVGCCTVGVKLWGQYREYFKSHYGYCVLYID